MMIIEVQFEDEGNVIELARYASQRDRVSGGFCNWEEMIRSLNGSNVIHLADRMHGRG